MNRNKAVIFSLSFLGVIAMDSVAPLIQKISLSFPDVNLTIIKQTITIPSMTAMFSTLLCGQLVRFLPKKVILLMGLLLYSVGGIGAGWAQNYGTHLFLRGTLGAGVGLISPIQTSLVADFFRGEERANMFGNTLAFSKFVAIIVPPLSVWLGNENWRNAFSIYIIGPMVLLFVLFALKIPINKSGAIDKKSVKNTIPPIVIIYAASTLVLLSVFFILVTDLTYLIETKERVSSIISAYGLSTTTVGTTIAGILFSKMYWKLKKWLIPLGALLCGGGFLLVVYSMSSSIMLGLLSIGFGLGILLSYISLSTTNAVCEADSTTANSIVGSATSFGIALSPFLYGNLPVLFQGLSAVQSNFKFASFVFLGMGFISMFLFILRTNNQKINHKNEV